MYALIGASNYSGSWKVYQSRADADKFKEILLQLGIPKSNITTLYDANYSRNNVLQELNNLANKLKDNDVAYIYFAGHGTQIRDRDGEEEDGMDEALQTDDHRLVLDDEITIPFTKSKAKAIIVSIADTCHSPSFDMWRFKDTPISAVSIKAALDYQSALQSGNGSYMSSFLFPLLQKDYTIRELQQKLDENMKTGFAGSLQSSKVEVSKKEIWNRKLNKL